MTTPLSDDETDLACLNCNAGPFDGLLDSCPNCEYDGALVWADEQVRLPNGNLTRKELP